MWLVNSLWSKTNHDMLVEATNSAMMIHIFTVHKTTQSDKRYYTDQAIASLFGVDNLDKLWLERGTAHKEAIHIWLARQFSAIVGCHRTCQQQWNGKIIFTVSKTNKQRKYEMQSWSCKINVKLKSEWKETQNQC